MAKLKSLTSAAFATAAGVVVLAGLGVWQLYRLEWKTALLERIAANVAAAPIALALEADAGQPGAIEEYRRVCAEGLFRHDGELYLFATNLSGQGGFHVITPLERLNGTTVLVNRGYVPPEKKDRAARPAGLTEGTVRVCGILLFDEAKGWFTPDNDPAGNIWYFRDSQAMAAALGLENARPFFVGADETPNAGGFPAGGQTRIDIPNNHLGYAITWFGLMLALLGVFSVYAWQRRGGESK